MEWTRMVLSWLPVTTSAERNNSTEQYMYMYMYIHVLHLAEYTCTCRSTLS